MFSKLQFSLLSEKKMKKCTSFEEQKGTSIFGEIFIFALLSSQQSCINWLHSYNENLPKHIEIKIKISKNWEPVLLMKEQWLQQHQYLLVAGKLVSLFACDRKDLKKHF